ncbi:twin-arginine translocation signal domain-containing protein [Nonomuraea guangzhouensis]|uniref:Twin-arginine translocation signal domain-containing protein n=1 Tax=Nonomuraea guangzhouensis TaxID=1291555 RepID=A0ABW4H0J8_9ACTN|nr:twin-arginine translocation signal domain-containing protein [Nonomuraea guangzhouensis]
MRPRSLSRRAVLAGGAAAAALSGCGASDVPQPTPTPAEDPERVLLRQLIADKEHTIALYSTLIAAGQTKLTPFRDRHQAHLVELRKRLPGGSQTATPAPSSPTGSAAPAPSSQTAAPAPKMSLSRLRDAERRSAALRVRQLASASPPLAQLIASIGACEAAHALALPRSA